MDILSMTDTELIRNRGEIAEYVKQLEAERDALREGEKPVPGADPNAVVDLWNEVVTSLPKVQKLTPPRRKAINARRCDLEGFAEVFRTVERSDFLTGRNGRWTGCGFDWVLKAANWQKVVEGNYLGKEKSAKPKAAQEFENRSFGAEDLNSLVMRL